MNIFQVQVLITEHWKRFRT